MIRENSMQFTLRRSSKRKLHTELFAANLPVDRPDNILDIIHEK